MPDEKLPVHDDDQVAAKIKEHGLDDWYLEDGWLRRKYSTDGWPTTLMLVNAIGYLCEAAWHHADLAVTWGKVWVKLKTHSAGGITDKDFALARKIEDLVLWRPAPADRSKERPINSCMARSDQSASFAPGRFTASQIDPRAECSSSALATGANWPPARASARRAEPCRRASPRRREVKEGVSTAEPGKGFTGQTGDVGSFQRLRRRGKACRTA